jgi:uncharacterized protein YjbI with pentapeptide repeats
MGDAMIERLVNTSGNLRDILELSAVGPVDLSSMDWGEQFVVIRGIQLDSVTIADSRVAANFVECKFDGCVFEEVVSDGHFSGAGNEWNSCRFKNCKLSDLIAPQSRFTSCEFDEVEIDGFRLCQTVFNDCSFQSVSIRGLTTRKIGDRSLQLPETVAKGASALFRNCEFNHSDFTGCKFNDVCFEDCKVAETEFKSCSFEDVISRDEWLRNVQSSDPFITFLDAAISGIRAKLGSDCESVRALEKYKTTYVSTQSKSKDYSEVLYDGNVPDKELDVVEKILDKVSTSFPF